MPTLRYLEYALALEAYGTHKRAALELHVSQPAVSKGIAALEREYGVRLFERNAQPAQPTVFGAALLKKAREAVRGVDELREAINALKGLTTGSVTIGVGPIVGASYIGPAMARLSEAYPGIRVGVVTGHWKELLAALRGRRIDLFAGDLSDASGPEFHVVAFPKQPIRWFCRAGHPILQSGPVSPAQLLDYPLAVPTLPPWAHAWLKALMPDADTRESPVTLQCDDYLVLKSTVECGNAISGAPEEVLAEELAAGRLALIPLQGEAIWSNPGVVRLRSRTPSPSMQVLSAELARVAGLVDDPEDNATARPPA